MDIAKIGSQAINSAQTFASKATKKITKAVPSSDLPISRWDFPIPWEVFEAKKSSYINKLYATYFDEKGKLIPEIKEFLDGKTFDIISGSGRDEKIVTSTIKDYLANSIHNPKVITGELYHGTQKAEKIIEEGFNPKHISRTNLGPGFYFAGASEASEYGTVIAAKIKDSGATCADADNSFYAKISHPTGDLFKQLFEFMGFSNKHCEETMIQREFLPKIIDEYARDYMVNDLGIDALKGYGGSTPFDFCVCILNPNVFENIRKY